MADMKGTASDRRAEDDRARQALHKSQVEDIARLRKLCSCLMDELERDGGDAVTVDELRELLDPSNFEMNSKVRQDKLNAVYRKVISLPDRIQKATTLFGILDKLIRMEREAHGLDKPEAPPKGIEEILAGLNEKIRAYQEEKAAAAEEKPDSGGAAPRAGQQAAMRPDAVGD